MTVYISGPMEGLPQKNVLAFFDAEDTLEGIGYRVLSPARLPQGMKRSAYMPICLQMVEQADIVAMLPGWENSKGARLEKAYAEYQGKRVVEYAWLAGKEAVEWE